MYPRTEYIQSGVVRRLDVLESLTYQGSVIVPTGDTTVKVSAADTTTGFLQSKIAAGSGISLSIANPGANEQLTISANVVTTDELTKVSANDTTAGYLNGKLVAGTGITLTENNNGANETLSVTLASHTHAAGDITSGVIATARLASSGTADSTTFLRGDQTWATPAGGVTGFTGSQNTASPNNTVNASRLLVDATSINADAVLQPKNQGSILSQLPDNTTTGGNKRGLMAIDLQLYRDSANQVASGMRSTAIGSSCRATDVGATAVGVASTATANSSTAVGAACTASASSAVAIGSNSTASQSYAVALGTRALASGTWSMAINNGDPSTPGSQATASSTGSIAIGWGSTSNNDYAIAINNGYASGFRSVAIGQDSYTQRYGQYARSVGSFSSLGDCQQEQYILRRVTTDATPTILSCDGAAPAATTRISIANDTTYTFTALVTARRTDADNESAGYKIEGVIDNNAGTTAFVGTPTVTVLAEDTAAWDVAVTADNTNDALVFTVTGENAKTIRWGAVVELMKISG